MATKADQFRANALHEVGSDYVWGAEGTGGVEGNDDYDCSGFYHAMLRDVGVNIVRTTANGYMHMGARINAPSRVGDYGVLVTNGHAHHIAVFIGRGDVVEAKGRAWGVVKTTVAAFNGRGAKWYRNPRIYLGELAGATPAPKPRKYPGNLVRPGERGPDVRWVQKRLNVHGYKVAVDGVYGPQTAGAVRSFRKAKRLLNGYTVGRVTWRVLAGPRR